MREHLELIAKTTGKAPKQLQQAEPPLAVSGIYSHFWALNTSRSSSGQSIPFSEIKAYCELTGHDLGPTTIDLIRQMDITYINWIGNKHKSDRLVGKK